MAEPLSREERVSILAYDAPIGVSGSLRRYEATVSQLERRLAEAVERYHTDVDGAISARLVAERRLKDAEKLLKDAASGFPDYQQYGDDVAAEMIASIEVFFAACEHTWDTGASPYCITCGIPMPAIVRPETPA